MRHPLLETRTQSCPAKPCSLYTTNLVGTLQTLLCCLQAAVPLPRLEAALGAQDAIWLSRLAQGIDDDEVGMGVGALPTSTAAAV